MDTHEDFDTNTAMDDLIRDHLSAEERHAAQPSDRLLRIVLQRAQTEVEQLPPLATDAPLSEFDLEEDDASTLPISALMEKSQHRPVRLRSIADTVWYYRDLMDLKMFRTLGACTSSLSITH